MPNPAAPLTRSYLARVEDVNPRTRTVVGKIATSVLDHYRTVVDPKGIDRGDRTHGYLANPIVLWEHGMDPARGSLPVGRNDWIRPAIGPNGPELIAQTRFLEGDDFAERLFSLYHDRTLRGFSVRVVPTPGGANSPPTKEEIRARPELVGCYLMYRSTRLTEYSAVAVPGNPEALSLDEARSVLACVSRGLALPEDLVTRAKAKTADGAEEHGDDEGSEEDPELDEEEKRYITHEGGKWIVHAEDGKVLGEHDSKAKAKAQLAAVEASKHKGDRSAPPPADPSTLHPPLPTLTGRSLDDRRAELLTQVRGLFDPKALAEDLRMRRDLARGKV